MSDFYDFTKQRENKTCAVSKYVYHPNINTVTTGADLEIKRGGFPSSRNSVSAGGLGAL